MGKQPSVNLRVVSLPTETFEGFEHAFDLSPQDTIQGSDNVGPFLKIKAIDVAPRAIALEGEIRMEFRPREYRWERFVSCLEKGTTMTLDDETGPVFWLTAS